MNEMSKKEIIELFIKTLFNWFSELIENKKKPQIKNVNKTKEYPIISARVDEKTRRLLTYNKELENVPYIINIINHANHPIENIKIYFTDDRRPFASISVLKAKEVYPFEVGFITVEEQKSPNGTLSYKTDALVGINKNRLKDFTPNIIKGENKYIIDLTDIPLHFDYNIK